MDICMWRASTYITHIYIYIRILQAATLRYHGVSVRRFPAVARPGHTRSRTGSCPALQCRSAAAPPCNAWPASPPVAQGLSWREGQPRCASLPTL